MQQYQRARRPARRRHSSFFLATMMVISSLTVFESMTLLSSELAQAQRAHRAASSGLMNAVVYDVTHGRYLTYNAHRRFITASSMKVPILLTFLDMIERQGRGPTNHELELLRTMIENSNNDSASALYYGEIGGAAGVTRFMQRIGITGLSPDPNTWGWSLITPLTMVRLLTRLYQGRILTAHDRHLALYLMEHVEADQRAGVGDTAPAGAIVAMKDGWVPAPNGLWAVNSSGIVITAQEIYIIAVYTQENSSLGAGWSVIRQVCHSVASQPH